MKFKMAEKSLFAILLRSPWWLSFCLVALFGLASKALLPDQYVIYGALGGFPFLVIGCIAAWRQLRAPNPERVNAVLAQVGSMSWRDFANALEQGFQSQGYSVARLAGVAGAGAADFKLEKGGRTQLVSARRWKAATQGLEPLKELVALKEAQSADQCSLVSLNDFTDNARVFAKQNGVSLIASAELAQLINR
jgi:restriction system protein